MPERGSVAAEPARRDDRLQFAEIQIADCAQRLRGRAVVKVVRQAFQPGHELNLCFHDAGDVVVPAPGPAAMIRRAMGADYRRARRARGAIAGRRDSGPGVRRRSWLFHRSIYGA
jgi:hypothetical protein